MNSITTQRVGATTPLPIRKNKMFDTVVRKYNNWKSYRRAVDELSSLSSRELQDLGISRGDIKFVARRSLEG
jgi:uncharacterized protein YjiS (DUF1127 family)